MSSKRKREQQLIMYLSKKQDFVTSEELMEVLNVSQKTVYRLINEINNENGEGPLILSERGRGYKLDYEKFINYQKGLNQYKDGQYTPHERRIRIMEELLLSSPKPISVYQLLSHFHVGESVIFNDEQIMSEELKKYNLVLERKNRTLAILGEEANIRKAIKDINEIFNVIDIDDLKRNKELYFNRYDVLFILDQLKKIEVFLASRKCMKWQLKMHTYTCQISWLTLRD
ncbi:HTH domain-containing protein [Caldifermentibacillus hisashii]|uniref:HTH domain-containing protein n=1 Tax=Caldifermentibacillus hisashii TaxID=996558 RepID=UPI0031FE4081